MSIMKQYARNNLIMMIIIALKQNTLKKEIKKKPNLTYNCQNTRRIFFQQITWSFQKLRHHHTTQHIIKKNEDKGKSVAVAAHT